MSETIIHLHKHQFMESEKTLVEYEGLRASLFLFPSGVHGIRLVNEVGQITMLPFQGQQIWQVEFNNRTLTMKSPCTEPRPTQEYLQTYGGFLIHCGAVAMGVPTREDSHPLHGELPNAPYQTAQLVLGRDARGAYIGVSGTYQHTVFFSHNYVARPLVKMYAGSTKLLLSINIHNLKNTEMELMYLAHVNFRPVDFGRLVYSAPATAEHVRVRSSIPSHIRPRPGYREFLDELARDPEAHHVLKPGLAFDPEVVFFIDYAADAQGWAHSMQVHPDGTADFIKHKPEQLDHGVRWISRTPDQDTLGIVLPATAEPEGYTAEKAKGNLKIIPAGGVWNCEMEAGTLSTAEAIAMNEHIDHILGGR